MKKLSLLFFLAAFGAFGQSYSIRTVDSLSILGTRRPERSGEVVLLRSISTNRPFAAPRPVRHSKTSTATVDNGCVFATFDGIGRWEADDCRDGIIDAYWYNAIGDGVTDDTAAFAAAASYIQQRGGGTLYAGEGTYLVSSTSVISIFTGLSNLKIDVKGTFRVQDFTDAAFTSVTLTNVSTTATATWASPHGIAAGQMFIIKNSSDPAYNGVWTVTTSNSPTVLTFSLTSLNVPTGPATALAHVSDINRTLFRFDSCTNVHLGNFKFQGTLQPRYAQYRLGWRTLEFRKGSKNIRGKLNVSGVAYGFYTGEYNNAALGGCSDIDLDVAASSVGYPVQATDAYDCTFRVVADNIHRGGFYAAVKRGSATHWIKNWDVAGAILSHQLDPVAPSGCEDFDVVVYDTGTTEPISLLAVGRNRYMITVSGYASTNVTKHKNLKLEVYGKDIQQASGLLVQTVASNHWIDGLTFSGKLDQTGLSSTNFRWPFFLYDTASTAGQYKDITIKDYTFLSPTNTGVYPAYIKLSRAVNDVSLDNVSLYNASYSVGLPAGIHANTTPEFPDWNYNSFEAASLQKLGGGIRLNASKTVAPLATSLGTNDFTIQWVGTIPSGNAGLFVLTSGSSATSNSFGASITNNHLIVKAYGATATDWRAAKVTDWAYYTRGDVVSLGIVRNSSGISIYTDGHTATVTEETSGTPPSWADALSGTNGYVGVDDSSSSYSGTVYRFAVWSFDYSAGFPPLAVNWQAGQIPQGFGVTKVDPTTENGSFETLGGGGADVFANWTESATPGSTITVSTNAVHGTNSIAMSVDASDNYAGVSSGSIMTVGSFYNVTFWAKISAGGSQGQIAIVGAVGGDYPISITDTWTKYTVSSAWDAPVIGFKRWSLTSKTALIDDIRVKEVGSLADFDWTVSPGDRITGAFSAVLGGISSRVISRDSGMSADRGDNSVSVTAGLDAPTQLFATALTGARTATLVTNQARRGDLFRFVRRDAGAGTLTLSTTPSYSVRTNTWVDVVYNGSSWTYTSYGTLTQGANSGLDADLFDGQDSAYFLSRANHTGTQPHTTITGLGGLATINDAPSDGQVYGRSNATWRVITSGGGLTNIFPSLTNMLVAGANVTLAINTTNQTIMISSSGGGGGATNGTSVSVNGGTALSVANINNTTGIAVNVSGTNVTFSIVDRDFGDLTVSSSGTVFTIDNGVINTNKIDATLYAWINNKPDLSDANVWTDANTFTKPIQVPSGGTGTNTHPAEALLVGNGTNVVKHLVASANKLAGWNGSSQVTNIGAGTGIAINDGVISATGTNAPQLGVNGSSVANPNLTNGPQLSPSVSSSNITIVINPNSIDTNKIDSNFYGLLMAPGGISDGDKGDITVSGSGATWTIDADSVALGTDTTGNYVASVSGTANEVTASGSGEGAAVTLSLPATIDLGGKTSFELPNAAAPTVDAFGEIAGDNDAWAAGRGAPVFYDGTAATRLVGVLASDTPSAGQVPKWQTGGTITWEDDTSGSGGSSTNLLVNTNLVTQANLIDSPTVMLTVDGSKIQAHVTNNLPAGWYANGFLPLHAGVSNKITGDLFRKQCSDIREPMWEDGTEWNAVGLRANAGKLSLAEYNTNDWTVLEEFIVVDPTDPTDDVITFGNSGFNNKVIFVADVEFQGAVTGAGSGDVVTTADNVLTSVNQFTNGLGQVFSVPPRVLGGRINGWTAPQMTPGTNAATQAQYKVLGDGIPAVEFDGTTSEEISMVGLLGQDPDRGSFVTITFASDDTANTVCWQARWQLLTLRGIDTNLLSTAATWTSNIPGTARVPTNITFFLNAPTGLVGSTNDFSKPYMLRITRLPGSDSSLSNAYLIGVDHRYGL